LGHSTKLKNIVTALLLATCTVPSLLRAANDRPPARVVTEKIVEQVVSRSSRLAGIINFARVSGVSSEVGGVVEQAPFEAGQLVEKDSLLAKINTDFVEKDILITRRQMGEVESQLEKQQNVLKRRKALMATNALSQDAFDDAFYAVQSLQRRLETFKEQIGRKRLEISKSEVRAPFAGLVLETFVERGEAIAPQTAVVRVAAVSDVEVNVSIAQSLLKFQRAGTQVPILIEALGQQIIGTIKGIGPMVDLRSKNITVKVSVPYSTGMLQNMAVKIDLPVSDPQQLRLINRDALVNFRGSDSIYTIVDNKARLMPVNIVTRLGQSIAVDNPDIVDGMPVVVDGNDRLQPDQAVDVIEVR